MSEKKDKIMIRKIVDNLSINLDMLNIEYAEDIYKRVKEDYDYLSANKKSMSVISKLKFYFIKRKFESSIKKLPITNYNLNGKDAHSEFTRRINENSGKIDYNNMDKKIDTIVIADLHGDMKKWNIVKSYLQKNQYVTLIILGDAIDRGKNGVNILLDIKALTEKNKAIYLPGNHDAFVYNSLKSVRNQELEKIFEDDIATWYKNDGNNTRNQFLTLQQEEMESLMNWWGNQPIQYKFNTRSKKILISTCNV